MLISCKSSECKACLPTGEKSALRYPLAVREKKRELDSLLGFIDKLWRSSGGGDGTC